MKHLPICLFVLSLCFFVGSLLDVGYRHLVRLGLWQATIACDNRVQELGKISDDRTCEFTIRNLGSRPLAIRDVKPGCGKCIQIVRFPRETILPGKTGVIQIALLTDKLKGSVQKSVAVFTNDPQQPVLILRLHAVVEKGLDQNTRSDDLSEQTAPEG